MREPKVLFYDIETSYVRARVWRTGKQYINYDQIVDGDHNDIICIGYMWEGQKKAKCLQWDLKKQCSDKMVEEFTKIIEKADVAIAHNGDRFDMRHLNTARLLSGKRPIAWPQTEDTLKQIRRQFYLPSYRLDYISKLTTGSGKNPMNFQDWVDIVEKKDEKALKKMVRYCKRDVEAMAEAYNVLKPHLEPKVNRSLIINGHRNGCPSCGSAAVIGKGYRTTKAGRYQRLLCNNCGHNFKSNKMEKNK